MDEVNLRIGAGECHWDPQCVTSEPDTKELVYELEAFGDASSSAYAAVVCLLMNLESVLKSDWLHQKLVFPTKGADHSKIGTLGCVNTGKVNSTDQDHTRTVSRYQPCPMLDRLEECSVVDQEEG